MLAEFSDYLAQIEDVDHRQRVETVLEWVQTTFPQLKPRFAWKQPMFTDHDTFVIGFSVAKQHMSVSPESAGIEQFATEIKAAGYSHGTRLLRIPFDEPVDYELLKKMIQFNITDKANTQTFWRK